MIVITTCNGYHTEATTDDYAEAVQICRRLEVESGDGFARVAWEHGKLVADAEGIYEGEERTIDAATATGMYDRY